MMFGISGSGIAQGAKAVASQAVLKLDAGRSIAHDFLKILSGHSTEKGQALEPKKVVEFNKKTIETFYDTDGTKSAPYLLGGRGSNKLNDYMALSLIVDGAKDLLKQYGGKVPGDKRMQLVITRLDGKDIGVNLADVPSNITPLDLENFKGKLHGQGQAAIDAITSQNAQIDASKNGKSETLSFPDCISVKVALRDL